MARNHLVFEDGTVLEGEAFGFDQAATGEVVFNTASDGYQESITDPSFKGQILIATYPLIGNYGITDTYNQSGSAQISGLVVREYCKEPSLMYKGKTLDSYMKEQKIPGISGIDTRDLVLKIRKNGTLKGAIVNDESLIDKTVAKLKSMPMPCESNLVSEVSCKKAYSVDNKKEFTVGVIDCGTRNGIISSLSSRFNLKVFPYDTPAQEIADAKVNGLFIGNGPGNPALLKDTVKTVDSLMQKMPVMGICLGSQIVALALGAKTVKMKYGHRGPNQPVRHTSRIYMTAQNHGFEVDGQSLDGTDAVADKFNLNDKSVEGIIHKDLPVFTCQFQPEPCNGMHDTSVFYDSFAKMIKEAKR